MIQKSLVTFVLALAVFTGFAFAGTIKIPKDKPAMTVEIPDSWKPEDTDAGITCESPDQVATVFFEVTAAKDLEALINDNVDWLTKEQKVKIDDSTKKEKDFTANGLDWKRISWDGDSKEWGPSAVGFMFVAVGDGKVLTVTYWITKKDIDKESAALDKIMDSIKPVQ
jgi:hypothetical protein